MADIELSPLVQQRLLHVLLDDESTQGTVTVLLLALQSQLDVLQAVAHRYPITAVAVFAWLHNPHVLDIFSSLLCLLKLHVFIEEEFELRII